MKYKIKIRFNHDCTDGVNYWRAIINNEEHHVKNVHINVLSKTTKDFIEHKNEYKWHISCESDSIEFKEGELYIN